ncbi:hypothetical protein ABDX07_004039 [Proteus mirabilis]
MEFKGTPAPWYVVERPDRDGCIHTATLEDENDNEIANLGLNVDHYDMLLIKAAPELLEQLIRLRNKIASYKPDDDDNLDIVDAVIAKALGQQ